MGRHANEKLLSVLLADAERFVLAETSQRTVRPANVETITPADRDRTVTVWLHSVDAVSSVGYSNVLCSTAIQYAILLLYRVGVVSYYWMYENVLLSFALQYRFSLLLLSLLYYYTCFASDRMYDSTSTFVTFAEGSLTIFRHFPSFAAELICLLFNSLLVRLSLYLHIQSLLCRYDIFRG